MTGSDNSVPSEIMPLSRAEQLSRQFFEWEQCGRGWHLWPHPVLLEPPFRPCYFRDALPALSFDDARKPTFFSSLIERLSGKSSRLPASDALLPPAFTGEVEPEAFTPEEQLVELQIALPQAQKIIQAAAEHLLLSLTYSAAPISFEVIGSPDAITVQLASCERDYSHVKQQVRSYFPEAAITEQSGLLSLLWQERGSQASVIADFGLSKEFMLPLHTASSFDVDPLIAVVGALSDLQADEVGILQVLFQAARSPWSEEIINAVTASDGSPLFSDCPDMVRLSRHKVSRPLFAAVVRVAACSRSQMRAWQIARNLGGAFICLTDPSGNELIPLSNDGYDDGLHEYALLRRCSFRSGMLLNSEELTSLVHLPSSVVRSEKLRRDAQNTRRAPNLSLNHQLLLGENIHNGQVASVTLSAEQRSKHTYIIGASGTGKSTLLLSMIMQDVRSGEGIGVLDPHGDLIDAVLDRIPTERHEDVIVLDPSDADYPIGFNILSAHSELEKNLLSSDLVAVFKRLSTSWGDQMTSVLGNAILAFLESSRGGTLADLRRFLVEADFRREFLTTVTDREVVYYWQKEFPLLSGKPQAPLLTRLDTFLRPKLIRYMVGQKENRLDFREIMNGRKIFLAKLAQGAIGEENSYLLGTLIVSKLHQMALGRQELKESARQPFYLYIDEFQNFITPSMASILSGARKYRLGLILAHQEFRQLWDQDTGVASAVIANPYARICFRLGDFDAQKLAEGFTHFEAEALQNLGVGEAIARIERSEFDFNLKTLPLPPVAAASAQSNRERVVALSRALYAKERPEVEAELARITEEVAQPKQATTEPEQLRAAHTRTEQPPSVEPDIPTQHVVPSAQPINKRVIPRTPSKKAAVPLEPDVVIPESLPLGRGGQQHKYLQQLIKRLAESKGFRVVIEQPVLGGTGSVDVSLERGDTKIACEISVTSTDTYELQNIQKCLATGYSPVILLSSEKKVLTKVQKLASTELPAEALSRVLFFLPDEFVSYLDELEAAGMQSEDTVRGYKVKVNYKAVGAEEKHARKQAISQVILQAFRRMKNPNS